MCECPRQFRYNPLPKTGTNLVLSINVNNKIIFPPEAEILGQIALFHAIHRSRTAVYVVLYRNFRQAASRPIFCLKQKSLQFCFLKTRFRRPHPPPSPTHLIWGYPWYHFVLTNQYLWIPVFFGCIAKPVLKMGSESRDRNSKLFGWFRNVPENISKMGLLGSEPGARQITRIVQKIAWRAFT